MPAAESTCARTRFVEFLTRKRLRLTSQRRVIVDVVFGTQQHFTAEQLLAWSRVRDRTISRATVYRTLPLLTASGLVRELDFGQEARFFDPNYADHPDHSHLVCQDCGRIVEFESDLLDQLEREVGQRLGFAVTGRKLQLAGACSELRQAGRCRHAPQRVTPAGGRAPRRGDRRPGA